MKRIPHGLLAVWCMLLASCLFCPFVTHAQIPFDREYAFQGAPADGSQPQYNSSLTFSGTTLFGVTQTGGQSNSGTLFAAGTNLATVKILHNFEGYSAFTPAGSINDGTYPYGTPLISGNMIYGLTGFGGSNGEGTIYAINTNGTGFTILHHFGGPALADGDTPHGSLVLSGSTLYGMTTDGTNNDGSTLGTIFSIKTDGSNYRILYVFGPEGFPQGALIVSGSTLYGMTFNGGSNNAGNIFAINTNGGGFQDLHSFTEQNGDGGLPFGSLLLVNSTLYGMTLSGGNSGVGTVFEINTDASGYNVLHSFSSQEASSPVGSLVLSGSGQMLYGMAQNGGSGGTGSGAVFQIALDGGDYQILHSFEYNTVPTDGEVPWGSPLLINSELYGMTSLGGSAADEGVIFAMPASLDTTPPGINLTSPSPGQLLNTIPPNITGTASDNVGIYEVKVEYNNGPWSNAVSANGFATWQAAAAFAAGTNTVQTYAIDLSGNVSQTNLVTFVSVFTSVLTVATNGPGTITGSLNGQTLQIGTQHSMTATAGAGSIFVNWTDGNNDVVTNGATINFLMASNLTLIANFQDITPPQITTTVPAANATLFNNQITATGIATDNVGVSTVFYSLNNGPWTPAGLVNTTWSAQITALLGPNTLNAYAVDAAGNISQTNLVNFAYALQSGLIVLTNGPGVINPELSGQNLQIGTQYSMTATADSGSVFVDWTDGNSDIVTNGATLSFIMASNLTFIANFRDVTAPVLTITAPKIGNILSNNPVVITGTATDNVAVASVFFSFNGGDWTNATLIGTNWSAQTLAVLGTNTLMAYAVDSSEIISTTNTVTFQYVQYAPLTVSTNGQGTINPPLNGHALQINATYSMTAAPATGSAFVDWTDGNNDVVTNGATVSFIMASNLTFIANFQDVAPPVLTYTSPLNGGIVNNSSVTVTGTATDNVSVSNVWYSFDSGAWTKASLSGTTWSSAQVTAVLGTNTVLAYAIDGSGNISPTNPLSFQYELNSTLTVITNGAGTITGSLNGQTLQNGSTYSMTAAAASGSVFVSWTDGSGNVLTSNPTLTFVMSPGLTLIANFRDTIAPTLTITSPKTGTKSSNDVVNVTGTAADNVAVSNVVYSLNGGPGTLANFSGGNWTAQINTISGTNTFAAYAVDFSGNHSTTNSIKLISVLGAQLIVNIVGNGTVKTDYNGDYLAIGHVYSMKATPAKGFGFYFWNFGAAMSNNATLKFTMVSNLVITANFKDTAVPTLAITSPKANAKIGNDTIEVTGTAADNVSVTGVNVQINNGGWQAATGTTSWNAVLPVSAGNNTIQAYAMDAAGNVSKTSSLKFTGNPPPTWAPVSIDGSTVLVTPSSGNPIAASFDATTFSQSDILTTNDSGIGTYAYAQTATNLAELSLTNSLPSNFSNSTPANIQLSFTGGNVGLFTNAADASINGTFSIIPATNFIPTSWSGHTVTTRDASLTTTSILKFTSNTAVTINTTTPGTYTVIAASPESALLVITDTTSGNTTYMQLTFDAKTGGNYEVNTFDNLGQPAAPADFGLFLFK